MQETARKDANSEVSAKQAAEPSLTRRLFALPGFQFVLHLVMATLPAFIYWVVYRAGALNDSNYVTTTTVLAIAATTVWFVMSRLRSYAKARILSYVFPVNFLVYTSVLSIIALFRIDYSAYQLVFGTIGGFLASIMTTLATRNALKLQLVIPGGRTSEIVLGGHYVTAPDLEEVQSLVEADRFNGSIVADLHHDHSAEWERLFAKASLAGIAVYHYRQVAEMQTGQVKISHLSENDLGSLIPNITYMTTKRAIDIVSSLMLLPVCAVIFVLLAIAVKLDSPGSVFFVQERVGFRGEVFRMVKFRTMRERDVADDEGAQRADAMTKDDDNRITRLGQFLRKTRLDELPQILNVLRGEMSWIGPRPEAKSLSDWYEQELPFYSYRHIVRPGITGWAQVNQGHVTDVEAVNSKLRFDFYYVKNISMWLDILIVLKTARVIFTGTGAK